VESDGELVNAVVAGNVEAYGLLVARYERSLCAIARAILRDAQLAEDAVQESLITAYRALPGLRKPELFGAWAAVIVRREAHAMAQRRPQLVALTERPAPEETGLRMDQEQLLAAVMRLPAQEKQVVMLRHFDGHAVADIAHMLGESVGTVTKRLSRGHERLRGKLKEFRP